MRLHTRLVILSLTKDPVGHSQGIHGKLISNWILPFVANDKRMREYWEGPAPPGPCMTADGAEAVPPA